MEMEMMMKTTVRSAPDGSDNYTVEKSQRNATSGNKKDAAAHEGLACLRLCTECNQEHNCKLIAKRISGILRSINFFLFTAAEGCHTFYSMKR